MVQSLRLYHFYCPNEFLRASGKGAFTEAYPCRLPHLSDDEERSCDGKVRWKRNRGKKVQKYLLTEHCLSIILNEYVCIGTFRVSGSGAAI